MWGVSRGLLAFYSRAVTDPRWGLRATFRGNEAEGTALALRDAGGGMVLRPNAFSTASFAVDQPSNVLFVRHRSQLGEKASLAGIVSLREWGSGIGTQVAGMDGQVALDNVNQVRGHVLLSNDSTALPASGGLSGQPIAQRPGLDRRVAAASGQRTAATGHVDHGYRGHRGLGLSQPRPGPHAV